ncbi:MAG: hypothetical protein ACR2NT_16360, partial [Acidimicrobiia bacterium]
NEMSVMIGIGPHKGSHTAVGVDDSEVVIDRIRVKTTADQLGQLRAWASGYPDRTWAVESAREMGYLVFQQLVAAGERVVDVPPMWRHGFAGWGREVPRDRACWRNGIAMWPG